MNTIAACLLFIAAAVSATALPDPVTGGKKTLRHDAKDERGGAVEKNKAPDESPEKKAEREKLDAIKKQSIRYSVLFAVPVNTYAVAMLTWDWGKTTHFRLSKEGWFERTTYAGGADKAAHLYSHYLIMRILYNVFDFTENGRPVKWAYAAGMTGFLALGIEIGDGFCRNQKGFSFGDITMGFLGIGIASLLELFPAVDAFVSLSAEYYPTQYFRRNPQRLKWLMDDYSGWKFMANIKLAGFRYAGLPVPEFMRYIQIDVGYYTTGFTDYDNAYGRWGRMMHIGSTKRRNIFIGVSVNLAEFIKDFFTDRDGLACRALQQPFKYYHIPLGARHSISL